MPYTYEYPRPSLTADALIFTREAVPAVLLIQRGHPPFEGRWALPGGFVEKDEDLATAAARELLEETGLGGVRLAQVGAYGAPGRDPRGWTVSVAFAGRVEGPGGVHGSDDAREARFFPIDALPRPLAFDHDRIVDDGIAWLKAGRDA